jgi:formate hydrogenlyase subunit 4
MAARKLRVVGTLALGLSFLVFCLFFLNVLIGGPLGQKPWMRDVTEMLTLFAAVVLFVAGTIAREAEAHLQPPDPVPDIDGPDSN